MGRPRPRMGGETLAYYDSIYQDTELGPRAKAVYIYINTIAAGVSLSRSTVKRALDDWVKAGRVVKSNRWRENESLSSNLYRLKW